MTATTVEMNYISLDEQGTARVNGTGIKVRILAEELREGYRPEEIQEAHNELSMAQVHAALAYYYANKSEFDEAIDTGARLAAESQAAAKSVVSRESLLGRLHKKSSGRIG